jgi:diguanylate cyclase (GGDEF)-like protein/PAS domain S-box-containing protein
MQSEVPDKGIESSYSQFLAQFPDSFQIFDWEGKFVDVTINFCKYLEYSKQEIIGKTLKDFMGEDDHEQLAEAFEDLKKRKSIVNFETLIKTKSGEDLWLMWIAIPLVDSKTIIAIDRDITIQRDISYEFILQQQKYKAIFDNIPMGLAITDDKGRIIETNKTAREYFDINDGERFNRTLNLRRYTMIQPNGNKVTARKSSLMRALRDKQVIRNLEMGVIKNASTQWFEILATPLPLEGFGLAVAFIDITKRKQAEEKITHMAFFDQLTNLPNRNSLIDKLFPMFEEARRHGNLVGVLVLDLDNFKVFNDSRGHDFGDKILKLVAYRITESIRNYDLISRQGGDEYTIILPDLTDEKEAAIVAESILDAMEHPFQIDGEKIFVKVSIGIAIYPNDGKDASSLLKNADTALNLAKQKGKNCYMFFTTNLQTLVAERLELESKMREALLEKQFSLVFQPKIDLKTYLPIGVEALLRWNFPNRGMISPDVFIPIAEETGMIIPIGEWVLKQAIKTLQSWNKAGINNLTMAVNISTKQFRHEKLTKVIDDNLKSSNVDPKFLELEITESSLMENPDMAKRILNAIRTLGVTIAIDDFGTGYSSLGYLRKFPISCLKIERTFVSEITTDKDSDTIVHAVSNLAHNLGLSVVAEGAETIEQVDRLLASGIDSIQGYYFSRPLLAEDCLIFLKEKLGISG